MTNDTPGDGEKTNAGPPVRYVDEDLAPYEVGHWAQQTVTGLVGRKATLLYLAGSADHLGSCFPGQESIAKGTEQSRSTVNRHIADLAGMGLLCHRSRPRRDGRGRTSDEYYLHVGGCCRNPECPSMESNERSPDQCRTVRLETTTNVAPDDDQCRTGATGGNSQGTPSNLLAPEQARPLRKPRPADPTWDAVVAACGLAGVRPTKPERGAWNRAVGELRAVNATPEEIHARARAHRRRWPGATLTPTSLARHWGEMIARAPTDEAGGMTEAEFLARKEAPWL